ncbi:uncharacterized protein LOC143465150 [Clavelina lepadiformis]|uniref:uncharacterized protein LOC143465150 n=1 Tax=Clavelina lepadiformis TaxID=159417 RepID=UPI0040436249
MHYSKIYLKRHRLQYALFKIIVLASIILVLSKISLKGRRTFTTNITDKYETYDFQEELVQKARVRSNCRFNKGMTYVICDSLPYTEIQCSDSKRKAKSQHETGLDFVVPNIIHFIWFGNYLEISQFYQFLSLRSVASLQQPDAIYIHHNTANNGSGSNVILNRIVKEIPCIHFVHHEEPVSIFNNKISTHLLRSDVARLQILLKHGGVYLDLDVITLKQFDPLRVYSTTFGRSVSNKISNGIILSEKKAPFIEAWYNEYKNYKEGIKSYAYWGVNIPMQLYRKYPQLRAHMEESSINRPNPWVDGWDATSTAQLDISDNYFLHVHPSYFSDKGGSSMLGWSEDRLRTLDTVYGTAARIALFGSPELVFLTGEEPFQMWPKRRFRSFNLLTTEDKEVLKPGVKT